METNFSKHSSYILCIIISVVLITISSICMADSIIPKVGAVSSVQMHASQQNRIDKSKSSLDSCNAYFNGAQTFTHDCRLGEVPPQVTIWLFLLSMVGFTGFLNRKKL